MYKTMTVNHAYIIKKLNDYAKQANIDRLYRGKRIYHFNNNDEERVFLLIEGDFFLRTSKSGKIIKVISAPYVIGAIPSSEPMSLFIEMIDYGKIKQLEYNYFWRLVNYQKLHSDTMKVMSEYHADIIEFIDENNENNEEHVQALVNRWKEQPPHIKKKISLLFYVTNSSFISKSTASRIIKRMKETGLINLKNGRIVSPK